MISNVYARAYTEVLEIINNFPEEEYKKIPVEKIEFYKNNKDENYSFQINPNIELSSQNISKEANAIIVNLFVDYFATEKQKAQIKEILYLNLQKIEKEKSIQYNYDSIFEKTNNKNISNEISKENNSVVSLVEYKENFFAKFKNWILKVLHINKE